MTDGEGGSSSRSVRGGRRILYLSKYFGFPLGGIRISFRHVEMLARNGFDARILLVDEKRDTYFEDTVPISSLGSGFRLAKTDLVVIPEPWDGFMRQLKDFSVRRYVFCQNHYYIFHGLGRWTSYEDAGVDTVFCCSEVIAEFLMGTMGLSRAPIIHNAIDHARFRPSAKRRQIAVMPRKMSVEAKFLRGAFRRRYPHLADVPWVEIAEMPEAEVARILGESAIFLALGRNEGFGLPPIEAMASGCLVVGFTGDGGRSFATDENGLWSPEGNWEKCVDLLAQAVGEFDRDRGAARVAAALATASEYSLERMERELVEFWQAEVER